MHGQSPSVNLICPAHQFLRIVDALLTISALEPFHSTPAPLHILCAHRLDFPHLKCGTNEGETEVAELLPRGGLEVCVFLLILLEETESVTVEAKAVIQRYRAGGCNLLDGIIVRFAVALEFNGKIRAGHDAVFHVCYVLDLEEPFWVKTLEG